MKSMSAMMKKNMPKEGSKREERRESRRFERKEVAAGKEKKARKK